MAVRPEYLHRPSLIDPLGRSKDLNFLTRKILKDPTHITDHSRGYWEGLAIDLEDPGHGIHGNGIIIGNKTKEIYAYNEQFLTNLASFNQAGRVAEFMKEGKAVLEEKIKSHTDAAFVGAYTALLYQLQGVPVPGSITTTHHVVIPQLGEVAALNEARDYLAESDFQHYEDHLHAFVATATDTVFGFQGDKTNIAQASRSWHEKVVARAQSRQFGCQEVYTKTQEIIAETLADDNVLPSSRNNTREILGDVLRQDLIKTQAGYVTDMVSSITNSDMAALNDYVATASRIIQNEEIGAGSQCNVSIIAQQTQDKIIAGLKAKKNEQGLANVMTATLNALPANMTVTDNVHVNDALATFTSTTITAAQDAFANVTAVGFGQDGTNVPRYVTTMSGFLTDESIGAAGKKPLTPQLMELHQKVVDRVVLDRGDRVAAEMFKSSLETVPVHIEKLTDDKLVEAEQKMLSITLTGTRDKFVAATATALAYNPTGRVDDYLTTTFGALRDVRLRPLVDGNGVDIIGQVGTTHDDVMRAVVKKDAKTATYMLEKSLADMPAVITATDHIGRQRMSDTMTSTMTILAPTYVETKARTFTAQNPDDVRAYVDQVVAVIVDPVIGVAGEFPLAAKVVDEMFVKVVDKVPSDGIRRNFYLATGEALRAQASVMGGDATDPTVYGKLHDMYAGVIKSTSAGFVKAEADVISNEETAKAYWETYIKTLTEPPFGAGGKCDMTVEVQGVHEEMVKRLAEKKDVARVQAFLKAGIDTGLEFFEKPGTKPDVHTILFNNLLELLTNSEFQKKVEGREKVEGVREATTFDPLRRYFVAKASGRATDDKVGELDLTVQESPKPNGILTRLIGSYLEASKLKLSPQTDLIHVTQIAIRDRAGQMVLSPPEVKAGEPAVDVEKAYKTATETPLRKDTRLMGKEQPTQSTILALMGYLKTMSPAAFCETVNRDPAVTLEITASHPHNAKREAKGVELAATAAGQKVGAFYARLLGGGTMHHEALGPQTADEEITAMFTRPVAIERQLEPGSKVKVITEDKSILDIARTYFNKTARWSGIGSEPPGMPYLLASAEDLKSLGFNPPAQWDQTRIGMFREMADVFIGPSGFIHDPKFVKDGPENAMRNNVAVLTLLNMGRVLLPRTGEDEALKSEYRKAFVSSLTRILTDHNGAYSTTVKNAALKVVETCLPYYDMDYQKQYVDEVFSIIRKDPWFVDQPNGEIYTSLMHLAKRQNMGYPVVDGQQREHRPICEFIFDRAKTYFLYAYPYADDLGHRRWISRGMLGLTDEECLSGGVITGMLKKPMRPPIPEAARWGAALNMLNVIVDAAVYDPMQDGKAVSTFDGRIAPFGLTLQHVLQAELEDTMLDLHPVPAGEMTSYVEGYEQEAAKLKAQLAKAMTRFVTVTEGLVAELPQDLDSIGEDALAQLNQRGDLKEQLPIVANITAAMKAVIEDVGLTAALEGGKTAIKESVPEKLDRLERMIKQLAKGGHSSLEELETLMEALKVRTEIPGISTEFNLVDGNAGGKVGTRGMGYALRAAMRALNSQSGAQNVAMQDTSAAANLLTEMALGKAQDESIAQAIADFMKAVLTENKDIRTAVSALITSSGIQEDDSKLKALQIGLLDAYFQMQLAEITGQKDIQVAARKERGARVSLIEKETDLVYSLVESVFDQLEKQLADDVEARGEIKEEELERRKELIGLLKDEFDNRLEQRKTELKTRETVVAELSGELEDTLTQHASLVARTSRKMRDYFDGISQDDAPEAMVNALQAAGRQIRVPLKLHVPTSEELVQAQSRGVVQEAAVAA